MQWSDLPLNPSTRTLREFAGLWLLFFGGLAAWQYAVAGRPRLALILAVLSVTVGPAGLLWPRLLRPIFIAWLTVVFPIGWIVSRVILLVLFFVVITPVGLLMRLSGRDVLKLRRSATTSHWTPKERPAGVATYFRQF